MFTHNSRHQQQSGVAICGFRVHHEVFSASQACCLRVPEIPLSGYLF